MSHHTPPPPFFKVRSFSLLSLSSIIMLPHRRYRDEAFTYKFILSTNQSATYGKLFQFRTDLPSFVDKRVTHLTISVQFTGNIISFNISPQHESCDMPVTQVRLVRKIFARKNKWSSTHAQSQLWLRVDHWRTNGADSLIYHSVANSYQMMIGGDQYVLQSNGLVVER